MKMLRTSCVSAGLKAVVILLGCSILAGCAGNSIGVNDPPNVSKPMSLSHSEHALTVSATAPPQNPAPNKARANPTVRVCSPSAHGDPCVPIANIYSDPSLTIPKTSTDTDDDGNFSFFARPGMYDLQVTVGDSPSQLVPVAVLPTSGVPASSNILVNRGSVFSFNLSGNLV